MKNLILLLFVGSLAFVTLVISYYSTKYLKSIQYLSIWPTNTKNTSNKSIISDEISKVLVIYVYFEKNNHHIEALKFFTEFGVDESDRIDYLFVIQGYNYSAVIPKFKNTYILKRENKCFDFGAIHDATNFLGGITSIYKYKAIIVLNSSVFGPILPRYWPKDKHWSEIFTSRLVDDIHIVGTVIACLPPGDRGGEGPRVSGMAFAVTAKAFQLAYDKGVFNCHGDKVEAILNGEYGLSKVLIEQGYNLGTILLMYGDIDWRKKENWQCNGRNFPFMKSKYSDGMDIHPLETVFYKPIWAGNGQIISETYLKETYKYMEWARDRKKIQRQ